MNGIAYLALLPLHPLASSGKDTHHEGSPRDPIRVIALKVYLCPSKVAWHLPEGKCQTLMLLSYDPDTRMVLSRGLNAMDLTALLPCQISVTS